MDKVLNWISVAAGAVGGFVAASLGGWDKWIMALVFFVVMDYITGLVKARFTKTLSSEIGFRGIAKKIFIFVMVAVAVVLQKLVDDNIPLRYVVVCFYLANEGISLLENMAEFLPIPEKIKEILLQLREKASITNQLKDAGEDKGE
jgi:toxin secretion/phage lysis holin